MSKLNNLYVGKAGQAFAMSEFLIRGWNVAIPEVDIGDDIFVVKDKYGEFSRVQVKTANGVSRATGISAQFNIPYLQLQEAQTPELTYFFLVRFQNKWQSPLLINRMQLLEEFFENRIGSLSKDKLILYFSFHSDMAFCSKTDLST